MHSSSCQTAHTNTHSNTKHISLTTLRWTARHHYKESTNTTQAHRQVKFHIYSRYQSSSFCFWDISMLLQYMNHIFGIKLSGIHIGVRAKQTKCTLTYTIPHMCNHPSNYPHSEAYPTIHTLSNRLDNPSTPPHPNPPAVYQINTTEVQTGSKK